MPTFTVDTREMAHSIDGMSSNVNKVTGTVVAMQSAVIAAKAAATEKVVHNLNYGFHALIQSQISRKVAEESSKTESLIFKLAQLEARLLNIQKVMEGEYHHISNRYMKIFKALDVQLKNRLQQTDKEVMELVETEIAKLNSRVKNSVAVFPTNQNESLTDNTKIEVSNVKSRASQTISMVSSYIRDLMSNDKQISSAMSGTQIQVGATEYMPLIVVEETLDASSSKLKCFTSSKFPTSSQVENQVETTISSGKSSNFKYEQMSDDVRNKIGTELSAYINSSNLSEDVKACMIKLFKNSSSIQTITKG